MRSSSPLALLLGRGAALAFIASGVLIGSGCQGSSDSAGDSPAVSQPNERTAPDAAASDAEGRTSGGTRVGAPSTAPGASGAQAPAGEDAAAPDPMRAEPGTPSTPAAPDLTCSTSAACKAVDSACGSCRCLILPADMEPPACTEPQVTCLVAPCLNKRAVCSAARCALQDQGPDAM